MTGEARIVKVWDVIVVGAGIIGLSLARELRKTGRTVLVVERSEPGREASHAAGGMLVNSGDEGSEALRPLADASAQMYPEFVFELQDESGLHIDWRCNGTICFPRAEHPPTSGPGEKYLTPAQIHELEPALSPVSRSAVLLKESCVDPRDLVRACQQAAKHRGVHFSSGDPVTSINISDSHVIGVTTTKTSFSSEVVVNCAGAWAGEFAPVSFPTRPVKGQMLSVVMPTKSSLQHVVRSPDVYLIPRSTGRLVIGATVEEAGFDKQVVPDTIMRLRQSALDLMPGLEEARILEAWAGLRPGTPDNLPILGSAGIPGYFVATGHYRDGILLAPITAKLMTQLISGGEPEYNLESFSARRFATMAA